jgi:hypothetical protein
MTPFGPSIEDVSSFGAMLTVAWVVDGIGLLGEELEVLVAGDRDRFLGTPRDELGAFFHGQGENVFEPRFRCQIMGYLLVSCGEIVAGERIAYERRPLGRKSGPV